MVITSNLRINLVYFTFVFSYIAINFFAKVIVSRRANSPFD